MAAGTLILRVVLGVVFIGHGTQKLFGWWNGGGPAGTAAMFGRGGFRPGGPFAILGGLAETVGGVLLLTGFLTPFGAAAVIGVMVTAIVAVHLPNGMWNTNGGIEFPLVNIAVAAALAFIGPGRVSVDHLLGWDLRGVAWGLLALGLGIVAAALVLAWRRVQLRREMPAETEGRLPPHVT
jgi:putative oxidoreductase